VKPLQTLECVSRFNRTTVECKFLIEKFYVCVVDSFNRTTVECKYKLSGLLEQRIQGFNRTTVEYKSIIINLCAILFSLF